MIFYDIDEACYVDTENPMWRWVVPPGKDLDFTKTFKDKFEFIGWYFPQNPEQQNMKKTHDTHERVTITKKEYDHLRERLNWLEALEDAGVDNWPGIDYAYTLLNEDESG